MEKQQNLTIYAQIAANPQVGVLQAVIFFFAKLSGRHPAFPGGRALNSIEARMKGFRPCSRLGSIQ
ncbi:hypothetical protein BU23DRAFT_553792 [Bimuria novae-zelandiae CBS 107.79]|uniref:Uncharacterized protein n=1 Tax=Bimuria novae-zelandiae CBS 107.79 TaxID=1447943 RepID=A0A6A5V9I5_9PLEO|nr:hypothetical protein BU23DRAFT_553792 [Bimuria novae-zelandiae CBS 107.79]